MLLIQLRKLCFGQHFIDLHALYKLIDLNIVSTHTDVSNKQLLEFFQEEVTHRNFCEDIANLEDLISIFNVSTYKFEDQCLIS